MSRNKKQRRGRGKFKLSVLQICVLYLRMSSDMQNPRSPQQQEDEIRKKIKQLNLPWKIVKVYIDSAVSGRTHDRPQLKRMLADLKTGRVPATLILVDNLERLSRSENANDLRRDLQKMGILVLTANTDFADPTSPMGQMQAVFESVRAADNNKLKAHEVRRGKNDIVRLGYWPGGPLPMGFQLELVSTDTRSQRTVIHHRLVEDEKTAWIIREIFRLADQNGWSGIRITEQLSQDGRISSCGVILKPTTVARILKNPIYIGRMEYGKQSREADGDVLFLEDNDQCEWEVNEEFCEGIVDREVWDRVQSLIEKRKRPNSSEPEESTPPLSGPGFGIALKHPFSGLVVCSECGLRMTASSTQAYTTVSGEVHEYVHYVCPGARGRLCENRTSIPEPKLREGVMSLVVPRLFVGETADADAATKDALVQQIMRNAEFSSFVESVTQKLLKNQPDGVAVRNGLIKRRDELDRNRQGWLISLGNQDISLDLRTEIQILFDQASSERDQINAILSSEQVEIEQLRKLASPLNVATRLAELWRIIGSGHASLINVRLAEHIDEIRCFPDRTVCVRFCRLGALTDPAGLTAIPALCRPEQPTKSTSPRRKVRRNLSNVLFDDDSTQSDRIDPNRFAELHEDWFEEVSFVIPERQHWYQEKARDVVEYRLETQATMAATAEHFSVTVPTIRAALKFAEKEFGIQALGKKVSVSTWKTWSRLHAEDVATFMSHPGATKVAAARHFNKSPHSIDVAMKIANETSESQSGSPNS